MAHASRAAHVYFRMRKTILGVCNSIYLHLLTHWCNCRKLTSFPGSAHTWLLLNDLVIEQRRALLLYKDKKIKQKSRVGNSSWIGLGVHDRVTDMQLQMTRTGNPTSVRTPAVPATDQPTSSAGNDKAMDVHIFGEVSKVLQVGGGSYKISYA